MREIKAEELDSVNGGCPPCLWAAANTIVGVAGGLAGIYSFGKWLGSRFEF